jgi:hypothetical protein
VDCAGLALRHHNNHHRLAGRFPSARTPRNSRYDSRAANSQAATATSISTSNGARARGAERRKAACRAGASPSVPSHS